VRAPSHAFAAPAAAYCAEPEELAFLAIINDYREQNGLWPLALSQAMGAAAEHHSADMAANDYFSHTLFDGTSWSKNMTNHGYTYNTYRGENIAAGNELASNTFLQWKNSPPTTPTCSTPPSTPSASAAPMTPTRPGRGTGPPTSAAWSMRPPCRAAPQSPPRLARRPRLQPPPGHPPKLPHRIRPQRRRTLPRPP
jgi:hypothetical protein